jgi:hypothetical protein
MEEKPAKDFWDKADIVLKPVGGLLTAVAIAYFGYIGSDVLNRRQEADTRARLYSELMSRREQSESDLRKDMFKSVIDSFFSPRSASIQDRVLNLELLAYNFHESLNLAPVFTHLQNEILNSKLNAQEKRSYQKRLHDVATEITRKQMLVLEEVGKKASWTVDLEELAKTPSGIALQPVQLALNGTERTFSITVLEANQQTQELRVRLEVHLSRKQGEEEAINDAEFWIGYFDFPMIDNTRLSHDQRCSLTVNAFDKDSVDLTALYFPGTYASLKEKPYYQEVVQNLLNVNHGNK